MSIFSGIFIGAYAIIKPPLKTVIRRELLCVNGHGTTTEKSFCPECGAKMVVAEKHITSPMTLNDLVEAGVLTEDKYFRIYADDEEKLILAGNQERETSLHTQENSLINIQEKDIQHCISAFNRLYYAELSAIGKTEIKFGVSVFGY